MTTTEPITPEEIVLPFNPKNVGHFDPDTDSPWTSFGSEHGKRAMAAHDSLVSLFDERIGGGERVDHGSDYANWLNALGINHQTENGWWNRAAVDPRNIATYINFRNDALSDDDFNDISEAVALGRGLHKNHYGFRVNTHHSAMVIARSLATAIRNST